MPQGTAWRRLPRSRHAANPAGTTGHPRLAANGEQKVAHAQASRIPPDCRTPLIVTYTLSPITGISTQGEPTVKRTLFLALAAGFLAAAPIRAANPVVEIDTSMGKIKVELDADKAPVTV